MTSIAGLLRPPRYDDEQTNSQASTLYAILLTLLAIIAAYMFIAPVFFYPGNCSIYAISLVEIAIVGGMLALARRGYVRLTSWLLCAAVEAQLLYALYLSGGIQGTGYFSHVSLVLIVGLLLGGRMALAAAGVSLLAGLLAWYATATGVTPHPAFEASALAVWSEVTLNILAVAIFLLVWERSRQRARSRARHELAERQRAENALAQSEEQLRLALSASRVGTWNWEMASNDVAWSEQVGLLFGLPPGESVGTFERYLSLLHPDDRPRIEASIQQAVADGSQMQVEHRVLWPDGSLHWLAGRGEILLGDSQQPVRMAGTVLDITEQMEAEAALRSSEARYRAIVESTDDFICRFLPDTTLTFVNEAYCRYFERSREELIGNSFLHFVPEEEHASIRAYLQELVQDDKSVTRRDGRSSASCARDIRTSLSSTENAEKNFFRIKL